LFDKVSLVIQMSKSVAKVKRGSKLQGK
jgi:hypothetical protein